MRGVDLLVSRFPTHEFSIRRLYAHDPEFRSVCEDYGDVQCALEHWQGADRAVPEKGHQYRDLLRELEAEALSFLSVRRNV